jgi:ADP-ribose pyrophosphatase
LLDVFPTPGYVSERMFVYAVEGLTPGNARPDADERISARHFSLRQLEIMIRRGRLRDAKSIAGILYYGRFCRKPLHR